MYDLKIYDSPFEFLKAARSVGEKIELWDITFDIDLQKIKREFFNLMNDVTDPPKDNYCSRLYHVYKRGLKKRGRQFDKESFFLYELAQLIRNSKVIWAEKIIFKSEYDKGASQHSAKKPGQKIRNIEKFVSDFIKKELPNSNINANPKRIKSKLWRIKKSAVLHKAKKIVLSEKKKQERSQPDYFQKKQRRKKEWKKMRFIYKVADYILQSGSRGVSQRELLRRFSNKRKQDIREILDILKFDCGIELKEEGSSTVYYCPRPGLFFVYYRAHMF